MYIYMFRSLNCVDNNQFGPNIKFNKRFTVTATLLTVFWVTNRKTSMNNKKPLWFSMTKSNDHIPHLGRTFFFHSFRWLVSLQTHGRQVNHMVVVLGAGRDSCRTINIHCREARCFYIYLTFKSFSNWRNIRLKKKQLKK